MTRKTHHSRRSWWILTSIRRTSWWLFATNFEKYYIHPGKFTRNPKQWSLGSWFSLCFLFLQKSWFWGSSRSFLKGVTFHQKPNQMGTDDCNSKKLLPSQPQVPCQNLKVLHDDQSTYPPSESIGFIPLKIDIAPENDALEHDCPLFQACILRLQPLIFRGFIRPY